METIQVIYIVGAGRSGSSILDRILGTLDGVSSFNEVRPIWKHGFVENYTCSCGQPFKACPFWTQVAAQLLPDPADIEQVLKLHNAVDHSRHYVKLYTGLYGQTFQSQITAYRQWLYELYATLAQRSGSNILIDSSKVPSRALLLKDIPGLQVHVIHLVRDLRAVIYAWQKKMLNPTTGRTRNSYSALRTTFFWTLRNLFCESLATKVPYTRLRYEDFAQHPQKVLQALVNTMEPTAGKTLPFTSEDSIFLPQLHTIGGSPIRFNSGVTQIRFDQAWMDQLDPSTRRVATLLAYPLLLRYGYTP